MHRNKVIKSICDEIDLNQSGFDTLFFLVVQGIWKGDCYRLLLWIDA